jgi:hypothetical protein
MRLTGEVRASLRFGLMAFDPSQLVALVHGAHAIAARLTARR